MLIDNLPSDSFLFNYLKMNEDQETPEIYDFWCGCWLLSCLLGRSVIIDRPRAPIYMNLYLLLVAESGITRKSTAINIAVSLLKEIMASYDFPYAEIIETKVSPQEIERLGTELTHEYGNTRIFIAVPELVRILGTGSSSRALPGLLTDLYDCPDSRRSPNTSKTSTHLQNVFCNFISASTPSWMVNSIQPDVVAGGFTSRLLCIAQEQGKRRIAWPEINNEYDRFRYNVKQIGGELLEAIRKFKEDSQLYRLGINQDTRVLFEHWYSTLKRSVDPYQASFEARQDDHVLRTAGFLTINRGSNSISSDDLQFAIEIIDEVKFQGACIFTHGYVHDRLVLAIERIRQALIKHKDAIHRKTDLYIKVRMLISKDQFDLLFILMHEFGLVKRFVPTTAKRGVKGEYVVATDKLFSATFLNDLIGEFNDRL